MPGELVTGVFALLGALVGGLFTLLAARVSHDWKRVKRHVCRLAGQVESYHRLEELYKEALAAAEPERGAAKTVLQDMRSQVEEEGLARPQMTARDAQRLRDVWC